MGDRSNLTKLDRTNGFDDGRAYMSAKKAKLAQQNDQIREALRHRNSTARTELFKGISINVNGRTQPTADELKRLILLNGGDYHPYYRYQTTKFMIATNLSIARMKTLRPDDRVVKPEWITESIAAKCLLPYQDYQLFVDEPRGKTGAVLAIKAPLGALTSSQPPSSSSTSSQQLVPIIDSYNRSYRSSRQKSDKSATCTKTRDIREMFSKSVRSLDSGCDGGKKSLNSSQISTTSIHDSIGDKNSQNASITHTDESRNSQESSTQQRVVSYASSSSITKHTSSRNKSNNNNSKQSICITMYDFVIKGARANRFPVPKVPDKRYIANICGLTGLDEIIGLINEWVGCPEGITDEDTACVTKYFYDLMSERDYHNKFYEVIDAFQQRVMQHDEACWKVLYNDMVKTLKDELNKNSETSQNLSQLINVVEIDGLAEKNDNNKANGSSESVQQNEQTTNDGIDYDDEATQIGSFLPPIHEEDDVEDR